MNHNSVRKMLNDRESNEKNHENDAEYNDIYGSDLAEISKAYELDLRSNENLKPVNKFELSCEAVSALYEMTKLVGFNIKQLRNGYVRLLP